MKQIKIKRENAKDIEFVGEQVAHFSNRSVNTWQSDSGDWDEFTVYKLPSGKYVAQWVTGSIYSPRPKTLAVKVVPSLEGLVSPEPVFGYGQDAKRVYRTLGIPEDQITQTIV